jgi:hypothetical protein
MKSGRCPKCGSMEVAGPFDMSLANQWARLVAFVVRNPSGWFSSWTQEVIQSWVCGSCGYMELYCMNPKGLIERFQQWRPER